MTVKMRSPLTWTGYLKTRDTIRAEYMRAVTAVYNEMVPHIEKVAKETYDPKLIRCDHFGCYWGYSYGPKIQQRDVKYEDWQVFTKFFYLSLIMSGGMLSLFDLKTYYGKLIAGTIYAEINKSSNELYINPTFVIDQEYPVYKLMKDLVFDVDKKVIRRILAGIGRGWIEHLVNQILYKNDSGWYTIHFSTYNNANQYVISFEDIYFLYINDFKDMYTHAAGVVEEKAIESEKKSPFVNREAKKCARAGFFYLVLQKGFATLTDFGRFAYNLAGSHTMGVLVDKSMSGFTFWMVKTLTEVGLLDFGTNVAGIYMVKFSQKLMDLYVNGQLLEYLKSIGFTEQDFILLSKFLFVYGPIYENIDKEYILASLKGIAAADCDIDREKLNDAHRQIDDYVEKLFVNVEPEKEEKGEQNKECPPVTDISDARTD